MTSCTPLSSSIALNMSKAFLTLAKRELTLSFRTPGHIINPPVFFLMIASLFPLGTSPQESTFTEIAGGIIWVGALLAVLLSLDSLFKNDESDGSLEQLLLSPYPLPILVLAKVLAHWLRTGLCLTLISPVLGFMLFLSEDAIWALVLSLTLGTPLLSLIGAIGAALTVRIHQGEVLITLISLPLYVPVLIFGTGSIRAAIDGIPYAGHLLWLATFLFLAICLAPLAIAGALRSMSE